MAPEYNSQEDIWQGEDGATFINMGGPLGYELTVPKNLIEYAEALNRLSQSSSEASQHDSQPPSSGCNIDDARFARDIRSENAYSGRQDELTRVITYPGRSLQRSERAASFVGKEQQTPYLVYAIPALLFSCLGVLVCRGNDTLTPVEETPKETPYIEANLNLNAQQEKDSRDILFRELRAVEEEFQEPAIRFATSGNKITCTVLIAKGRGWINAEEQASQNCGYNGGWKRLQDANPDQVLHPGPNEINLP